MFSLVSLPLHLRIVKALAIGRFSSRSGRLDSAFYATSHFISCGPATRGDSCGNSCWYRILVYGNWASRHLSVSREMRSLVLRISVIGAVIIAFILPTVALWVRASELGAQAREGQEIQPFQVLGLPVLDVRAYSAKLSWVGADHAWPSKPFGTGPTAASVDVRVIARDSSTVILLVLNDCRVARLNAAQVSFDYRLPTNDTRHSQEGCVSKPGNLPDMQLR